MKKPSNEQLSLDEKNSSPSAPPNNRGRLIIAVVLFAAVGLGAYVTSQRKPQPVPVRPVPLERGEAISAPVEAPSEEKAFPETVSGDAILAGLSPDQKNGPKISLWKPEPAPPRPASQAGSETSQGAPIAPAIQSEEERRRLELADRLKLEREEEALSYTDDNTPLPKIGEYTLAGFNVLANYRFEIKAEMLTGGEDAALSAAAVSKQIPQRVKDLNEKQVAAQGFMMPVKGSFGEWSEFLLVRNRANCCYGKTPKPNEWIMVRTAGKGVPYIEDEVVTIFGTLRVGDIRQQGAFTGIYEMNCDKVERADKVKAK